MMTEVEDIKTSAKKVFEDGKKKLKELQDAAGRTKTIIFPKEIFDPVMSLARKYNKRFEDMVSYSLSLWIFCEGERMKGHTIVSIDQTGRVVADVELPK